MSKHLFQQPFQLPDHTKSDCNATAVSILELACQWVKPKQGAAFESSVLVQRHQSSSLILDYLIGEELGI